MDEFEVSDIQHSFTRIDSHINLAPGRSQIGINHNLIWMSCC